MAQQPYVTIHFVSPIKLHWSYAAHPTGGGFLHCTAADSNTRVTFTFEDDRGGFQLLVGLMAALGISHQELAEHVGGNRP